MDKSSKNIMVTATVIGAITILIGAFGAHGLKELVTTEKLITFETGVRYQMYHVFALLLLGIIPSISKATRKWTFRLFCGGIVLFSGSIYLLALQQQLSFNVSFLGPITPMGGLLFVLGWSRLAYGLLTLKRG